MKFLSRSDWRFWFWLLVGIAVVAAAFPLDARVDAALTLTRHSAWRPVAWWCSEVGQGWFPAVAGIFFALIYLFLDRPKTAARIFFVALTCELTGLAALILRILAGRTRPAAHDAAQGFYGLWHAGHWVVGKYEFSSFPSGHTATAMGVAAAAWLVQRGWGAVLALYAVAVMWSRLALQAHHLSDVLASTVLSIALAIQIKPWLLPCVEFQFDRLHRTLRKRA